MVKKTRHGRLEQAREFVALGERRVREQKDLVGRITARGGNANWALEVLGTFESTLKIMQQHLVAEEERALAPD